jgi:hypothetical protein
LPAIRESLKFLDCGWMIFKQSHEATLPTFLNLRLIERTQVSLIGI